MKRICMVLCISLFANWIHAAVMPTDVQPARPLSMDADKLIYHCHSSSDHDSETAAKQSPETDRYQCCLQVALFPVVSVASSPIFTQTVISEKPSRVLEPVIDFIFKPPKTMI